MPKKHSHDLFDDTTMTFGEHLEELRVRLWRAVIGLAIGVSVTMYYGDYVLAVVRKPIEDALKARAEGTPIADKIARAVNRIFGGTTDDPKSAPKTETSEVPDPKTITIEFRPTDLLTALHEADPERFPLPKKNSYAATSSVKPEDAPKTADRGAKSDAAEKSIRLKVTAPEFEQLQKTFEHQYRLIGLTVQEGFMTWMKVSFVAGLVLSSWWVILQLWLFVAAGLYPHERKYVYVYLPFSTILFLGGAAFCFFCVFPFVLDFLLAFSESMKVQNQIRLAEWIDFAIMLPVMFGISFQLPLVMLFLERLSIFEVKDFTEKRRIAIFIITVISMVLTPAEPYSMVMMMLPLIVLYEMGIWICRWFPKAQPFDDDDAEEKKTAVATS
jgi:sec-independent protein translocase protein TatC